MVIATLEGLLAGVGLLWVALMTHQVIRVFLFRFPGIGTD